MGDDVFMSDFAEAFINLLPNNSNLRNTNNAVNIIINDTVGEWFDNNSEFVENLFLNTAKGKYLDLFGKDYGVHRNVDENDDDYRDRIIFEKLEYLTVKNLIEIFKLNIYCYVEGFPYRHDRLYDNVLTSDNLYASDKYMIFIDSNMFKILSNKFVLDNNIKIFIEGDN